VGSSRPCAEHGGVFATTVLGLVVAACGPGSSASSSPASIRPPATPSLGCGTPATPGSTGYLLHFNGADRTYVVHVPKSYNADRPTPLVLALHDAGDSDSAFEVYIGLDATANHNRFLVVYPNGSIPYESGWVWSVPGDDAPAEEPGSSTTPVDVAFLTALVSYVEKTYCVDERRVYALGLSSGARMADVLACDDPTVFAAVAPVSGLRIPMPCLSTRPLPIITFHGTDDTTLPYDGSDGPTWTYSVPEAASLWASHNGCRPSPQISHSADAPERAIISTYEGCRDDGTVQLYTIEGGLHDWPGSPFGGEPDAPDADAIIWSFFAGHPLPASQQG